MRRQEEREGGTGAHQMSEEHSKQQKTAQEQNLNTRAELNMIQIKHDVGKDTIRRDSS